MIAKNFLYPIFSFPPSRVIHKPEMEDKQKKTPKKTHTDLDDESHKSVSPDNMRNSDKKSKSKKDKASKDKTSSSSSKVDDVQGSSSEESSFSGTLYVLNEKRKGVYF